MYISVNDGQVIFATYFIRVDRKLIREAEKKDEKQIFPAHQVESDGIVCYSKEAMEAATKTMDAEGIGYEVEELDHGKSKARAEPVKYASRSEAIKHLVHGEEPETIGGLRKEVSELRATVEVLKSTQAAIKGGLEMT